MALINCPECGKEISDKAASCPNCGNPMDQQVVVKTVSQSTPVNNDRNMLRCPKCDSTQLTSNKKGFSARKAVAGAIVAGGIGITAGAIGGNKIIITCLKCGRQFKPGEGDSSKHFEGTTEFSTERLKEILSTEGMTNAIIYRKNKTGCDQDTAKKYVSSFAKKNGIKSSNKGCAGVFLLFIILSGSLIAIL